MSLPIHYLCGSEVFVTGEAMQPCRAIAAPARRLADHLASRLCASSVAHAARASERI